MSQPQLIAVTPDGMPFRGLAIGDMRGFGRVRSDAALDCLALDRQQGLLHPCHSERALLSLQMDGEVTWASAYVPGTNVVETVGRAGDAELRVADFMAVAEARAGQGDAVVGGRFVRIVSCTEGEVSFRIVCATQATRLDAHSAQADGGWHLACSRPLGTGADVAGSHVRLVAGESVAFVIASAPMEGGPGLVAEALHMLGDTIHFWTWWSDRCRYKGDDFDARLREVLGLKLACGGPRMLAEEPHCNGFSPAPMHEATRAAATFLELGYRQECAELLAQVYEHGLLASHGRWSYDERFVETLEQYALKYGTMGLVEPLRAVLDDPGSLRQHGGA